VVEVDVIVVVVDVVVVSVRVVYELASARQLLTFFGVRPLVFLHGRNYRYKLYNGLGSASGDAMPVLEATDSEQDADELTYTVCEGSAGLPAGITLQSTGSFTGKADLVEKDTLYEGSFCVADGKATDTKDFAITVTTQQVVVFAYTGKDQVWNPPTGVTSARVSIWGAGGGTGTDQNSIGHTGGYGGGGGYTTGSLTIPKGTEGYVIVVGICLGNAYARSSVVINGVCSRVLLDCTHA
jgi:hypothetical protein